MKGKDLIEGLFALAFIALIAAFFTDGLLGTELLDFFHGQPKKLVAQKGDVKVFVRGEEFIWGQKVPLVIRVGEKKMFFAKMFHTVSQGDAYKLAILKISYREKGERKENILLEKKVPWGNEVYGSAVPYTDESVSIPLPEKQGENSCSYDVTVGYAEARLNGMKSFYDWTGDETLSFTLKIK